VMMTDPIGRSQRLPAEVTGSESQWTFTDTTHCGVYTVAIGGKAGDVHRYAVNLDTRESLLERLDPDLLPSPFLRDVTDTIPVGARATALSSSQSFRYVLATVLLLLLCETLLAWFFGRSAAHASVVR
jgi:hypothetical protein